MHLDQRANPQQMQFDLKTQSLNGDSRRRQHP